MDYNTPLKALNAKYSCQRCSADLKVKAQRCKTFNIQQSDQIQCYQTLRNSNGSFVDADSNVQLIEQQGVRNKWWPATSAGRGGAATDVAGGGEWTLVREKGQLVAYPAKTKKRQPGKPFFCGKRGPLGKK